MRIGKGAVQEERLLAAQGELPQPRDRAFGNPARRVEILGQPGAPRLLQGQALAATVWIAEPVAVEIRSAGICAARPSPIESSANVLTASENERPCWVTPITIPVSRLIATMMMPAIASPLTNVEAPCSEP